VEDPLAGYRWSGGVCYGGFIEYYHVRRGFPYFGIAGGLYRLTG